MGGMMGSGGTKAQGTPTNGTKPAWASGSGASGNSMLSDPGKTMGSMAAAIGNGGTTGVSGDTSGNAASTGGAAPAGSPGMTGDWSTPGTAGYNNMNNLLATQPMGNLVNLLQSGGMGGTMNSVMQNLAGSSGSNNMMDQAAQMFQQLGGPQGTANFQNLYNAAGQPGAAQNYLGQTASGGMLNSNPYIDAIVQKGQDEAGTGVNQMFAAGGRYGGAMNQGTLADSYQNIGNQFRGQEYENERGRQMQAAGAISNEQLGRMGIQGNAAQGVGNLQQAGASGLGGLGQNSMQNWLSSQMGAAGLQNQGIQNQLAAMGQLGNVQNNKTFDANQQAQVGQETTQASQNQLNDLINQWTQGDMQGWARLGGLLSAGTGSAGSYGTGTGTTKQSSSPGAASIIGGILSLVGMSDRRTKTDIEPLDATLAGVPLYRFRYRTDPTKALRIGVMADEVREIHPDAVIEVEGGYDHVNYALLRERHVAVIDWNFILAAGDDADLRIVG